MLAVRTPPEIAAAYGLDIEGQQAPEGTLDWDSWRDGFAPRMQEPTATALSIIYTSGTTGHPKGVKRPAYTPEDMERLMGIVLVAIAIQMFLSGVAKYITSLRGPGGP